MRGEVDAWLARRTATGATEGTTLGPLPDAEATDWGWRPQQAYAVGLDARLRQVEDQVSRAGSLALLSAAAVGLLAGVVAASAVVTLRGR